MSRGHLDRSSAGYTFVTPSRRKHTLRGEDERQHDRSRMRAGPAPVWITVTNVEEARRAASGGADVTAGAGGRDTRATALNRRLGDTRGRVRERRGDQLLVTGRQDVLAHGTRDNSRRAAPIAPAQLRGQLE